MLQTTPSIDKMASAVAALLRVGGCSSPFILAMWISAHTRRLGIGKYSEKENAWSNRGSLKRGNRAGDRSKEGEASPV